MSRLFIYMPDDIKAIIKSYEPESFDCVYRAIRHTGQLEPKDFYPSFDDEYQKKAMDDYKSKGDMAKTIGEQVNLNEVSYYAVSLFENKDRLKEKLWRRHKERFPLIAIGNIDSNKGIAHRDGDSHISYYLFDHTDEKRNPYNDFKKDEDIYDE